jgi:hypothetical protein
MASPRAGGRKRRERRSAVDERSSSWANLNYLISAPMADDADRFREQAKEATAQAAKAINPVDREAWLRVAEDWLELAVAAKATRRRK